MADKGITTTPTDDLWQRGTVSPGQYTYAAKVFDKPSENGIDGGNIAKLTVKDRAGNEVAAYDRGWDQKPESPFHEAAVKQIVSYYWDRELPSAKERPKAVEPEAPKQADQRSGHEANPMGFFTTRSTDDRGR